MSIKKTFPVTSVTTPLTLVQVLSDGSLAPLPLKNGGIGNVAGISGAASSAMTRLARVKDDLAAYETGHQNSNTYMNPLCVSPGKRFVWARHTIDPQGSGFRADFAIPVKVTENIFMVLFPDGSNSDYLYGRTYKVDPYGNITTGDKILVVPENARSGNIMAAWGNDGIVYCAFHNGTVWKMLRLNVSHNAITVQANGTWQSNSNNNFNMWGMCRAGNDKVALLYTDPTNNYYLTLWVSSAGGIGTSSIAVIENAGNVSEAALCSINDAGKIGITYVKPGVGYSRNTLVVDVSGGSIVSGTKVVRGNANKHHDYCAIAPIIGVTKIVIAHKTSSGTGSHGVTTYNITGNELTQDKTVDIDFGSTGDATQNAQLVKAHDGVCLLTLAGYSVMPYSKVFSIVEDELGVRGYPVGIAINPSTVIIKGEVNGFTGLLPGEKYYADASGTIGLRGQYYVGYAKNETTIIIPENLFLEGMA